MIVNTKRVLEMYYIHVDKNLKKMKNTIDYELSNVLIVLN